MYIDDNPKTQCGDQKPSISCAPPVALFALGRAMKSGADKYGRMNWRDHTVSSSVYYDAAMRHLMAWWDGEDFDAESGIEHLGHVLACVSILIDGYSSSQINDDRPTSGSLPDYLKHHTQDKS